MSLSFQYIYTSNTYDKPVALAVVTEKNQLVDHFSLDELADEKISISRLQTAFRQSACGIGSDTPEKCALVKDASRKILGLDAPSDAIVETVTLPRQTTRPAARSNPAYS